MTNNDILTERENDVMNLVAKGFNNKQICKILNIERSTIKTHLANIYQKYSVNVVKSNRTPVITRVRAVLIYLGLAKLEDWNIE